MADNSCKFRAKLRQCHTDFRQRALASQGRLFHLCTLLINVQFYVAVPASPLIHDLCAALQRDDARSIAAIALAPAPPATREQRLH